MTSELQRPQSSSLQVLFTYFAHGSCITITTFHLSSCKSIYGGQGILQGKEFSENLKKQDQYWILIEVLE